MKFPDAPVAEARRAAVIDAAAFRSSLIGGGGAVAIGALAVGAAAIGALAIGRLAVGSARIKRLRIDELDVGTLTIDGEERSDVAAAAAVAASRPAGSSKLSHVDLVVTSLERSLPFYQGLLGPLGWTDHDTIEGERGEDVHYLSVAGSGVAAIGLRQARSRGRKVPYDRYGLGIHHVCIDVPSRELVDERAAWVRASDAGEVISGPAAYDYTPGYYAVFIADPDGLKLELLHRPTYWDSVASE